MITLVCEVQYDDVNLCMADGSEITDAAILEALGDCTGSGDAEPALKGFMDSYSIAWRTVRCISRNPVSFENVEASPEEITTSAETIYFESASNFTDQDTAKMYLLWQAAHDYEYSEG